MPFVYRLQKIIEFKEKKRDEQREIVLQAELAVRKAHEEVMRIQHQIDEVKREQKQLYQDMLKDRGMLLTYYDNYIKHLDQEIEQLELSKERAINILEEKKRILQREKETLAIMDREINALEKHKENKYLDYLDEERKLELKKMDAIAGQKFFAKNLAAKEEAWQDGEGEEP